MGVSVKAQTDEGQDYSRSVGR